MITIVTGTSENHFKSLCQFLSSIFIFYEILNVYVYDLGLSQDSLKFLEENYPKIKIKLFDFSKYPSYFNININAGEYAWKPVIIEEVSKEKTGILIWMDSGNKIVNKLDSLIDIIKKQGIYSPISSGTVKKWTHFLTLEYFNIDKNSPILSESERNGAVIGFDLDNKYSRYFIEKFSMLSKIKECIAPLGSNRTNHRQDQAIFTLLYYIHMRGNKTENNYIGFTIHNDID